jgi:hypothetical protein
MMPPYCRTPVQMYVAIIIITTVRKHRALFFAIVMHLVGTQLTGVDRMKKRSFQSHFLKRTPRVPVERSF